MSNATHHRTVFLTVNGHTMTGLGLILIEEVGHLLHRLIVTSIGTCSMKSEPLTVGCVEQFTYCRE